MNPLWSWILAVFGLTGLWLAGAQRRIGWAIGAAAQILWAAYALATSQHGFLATACAYFAVYTHNYLRSRTVTNDVTAETRPAKIAVEVPVSALTAQQAALPAAIIIDLDGTLCLRTTREPYDESPGAVLADAVNPAVLAVVQAFDGMGVRILFTSGRRETCREDTRTWLAKHLQCPACPHDTIPFELFMRSNADQRPDTAVKLDLYHQHIFGRYRIIAVFDDRQKVVDLWRSLGLTCMQVAPGDF